MVANIWISRLLARFAPIFYFTCQHGGSPLFTNNMRVPLVNKTKTKKFADFIKKISWNFKIFKIRILIEPNFWKFDHPKTFPGVTRGATKNLGPIGSAVYWIQTNRRPDKQSMYIDGILLLTNILILYYVLKAYVYYIFPWK